MTEQTTDFAAFGDTRQADARCGIENRSTRIAAKLFWKLF